jgi:hypothetical protein
LLSNLIFFLYAIGLLFGSAVGGLLWLVQTLISGEAGTPRGRWGFIFGVIGVIIGLVIVMLGTVDNFVEKKKKKGIQDI